jgi:hypothetical protein
LENKSLGGAVYLKLVLEEFPVEDERRVFVIVIAGLNLICAARIPRYNSYLGTSINFLIQHAPL